MSSFDDIFQSPAEQPRNQTFDKDAWAAKKQATRQQVYDLADATAVQISQDGNKFRDYLDVQSRFGRYSVTNALLILAQKPQATQVKSFEDWQDVDVSIKRYEKGFTILEPGKEYDREDGSKGTSFEPKKVFDISQTTARVKTPPETQRDDRAILKALIHKPPVPIQTVDELLNKVRNGFRRYSAFVMAMAFCTLLPTAASATGGDPLTVVNNLSDLIFSLIRAWV